MEQLNQQNKGPLFWASALRIIGTLLIFIFHSLSQSNISFYKLNIIGISIFCFLSGYFCYPIRGSVIKWLIKRFQNILVPYWIVIFIVIAGNHFYQYKENSMLELIVIVMGGAMFIDNPLYVVSWYITFILLLYVGVGIYSRIESIINRIFFLIIGTSIYVLLINKLYIYLIMFISGYLFKLISSNKRIIFLPTINNPQINNSAFVIQNHCYSFFLIHGGVLISLKEFLSLNTYSYIILSFVISSVLTIGHKQLSDKILNLLQRK